MQYASTADDWTTWSSRHLNADDDTKLAALREYIELAARRAVGQHHPGLDAAWMNKKLGPLGITTRIPCASTYILEAPVTATASITVVARDRAEARQKFGDLLSAGRVAVGICTAATDPVFTSGPEDADAVVPDPEAPTTVTGTLMKLRETIMLAHIAGPKVCRESADEMLEEFGLLPLPQEREYVVTRKAPVTMQTIVTAYDEQSAQRVATWRWDTRPDGFDVAKVQTDNASDWTAAAVVH